MIAGMESQRTRDSVRDRRIERVVELLPPATLFDELPLGEERTAAVVRGREEVAAVLDRDDDRLLVVAGPCSVHDPEAALDYARRLAAMAADLGDDLLVAMRVYFEKPRTTVGWKGLINDPHLDGSGDVNSGLRVARELLLDVLDLGLSVGCEFLDPITPQYIADTVAWGAIGARTSESQTHRQLGSGLSMPVGFKNRTDGNVQVAVDAVRAAAAQHAFAGIDDAGRAGDPPHGGQPRRPRHPARRRRWAELRRRRRLEARSSCFGRRAARAAGDRRLARQQRQGPRPPGAGGGRDRRAGCRPATARSSA